MTMLSAKFRFTLLIWSLLASGTSYAGIYADDLSRCLVSNTTSKDKTELVRWIFSVASLHPEVSRISAVSEAQREDINREMASLLERLVTETCRKQSQDAIRYEGEGAMRTSFEVLGQVAMQELMTNQSVRSGFAAIGKYIDESKFRALAPSAK